MLALWLTIENGGFKSKIHQMDNLYVSHLKNSIYKKIGIVCTIPIFLLNPLIIMIIKPFSNRVSNHFSDYYVFQFSKNNSFIIILNIIKTPQSYGVL